MWKAAHDRAAVAQGADVAKASRTDSVPQPDACLLIEHRDVCVIRPILAGVWQLTIIEGRELHAHRKLCRLDIGKAGLTPSGFQFAWPGHRAGAAARVEQPSGWIQDGRGIEEQAAGNEAATCVPDGGCHRRSRSRDAAHLRHSQIRLGNEMQHQEQLCPTAMPHEYG